MDLKDLVREILTSTTMHSDASLAMNSEAMKMAEERLFEALFEFRAQILTEAKALNPTPE